MTFYLPKPDKFYKLQSPWTFQITLDSRNREIYEKLTGEEAGYSKFYRLRREDAEPPECTLPEDTVIDETKESGDGGRCSSSCVLTIPTSIRPAEILARATRAWAFCLVRWTASRSSKLISARASRPRLNLSTLAGTEAVERQK